jgi:hypothetical protein
MSAGNWPFKPKTLLRLMRTIESAGHPITQVQLGKDGSITIATVQPPPGEPEGDRPNSFDQVLGAH